MIKDQFKSLVSLKGLVLMLIVLVFVTAGSGYGITVFNQPYCKDLIAGQNINAGNVCFEVVGANLLVTYTTTNGWELTEAHLWVGENIADMPQTRKGNPKIGHFPYNSYDITGADSHSFLVPLSSLGDYLCGQTFYAAAYAEVRKALCGGGYQTESAWGSGWDIVPKGSWAMYFSFKFICCDVTPLPPPDCKTAFAFGDKKLWDIIDPATNDPITNRWGWLITVNAGDTLTRKIYTGALGNDITRGTHVGDLEISYDGSTLTVSYVMTTPYFMRETHIYAGTVETDTVAPGQLGNIYRLDNVAADTREIQIIGSTIYIVAHAVVGEPGN